MILDNLLMFDIAGSLNGGALGSVGANPSTNVIDLHGSGLIPVLASGQGARDIGVGDNPAMKVLCQVNTTVTSGGALTLAVAIQGAPDNGSGAPGTYTSYASSPSYALATLAAGARLLDIDMPRPPAGIAMPRFLRMLYTVGTAAGTGGTITSALVLDRQDYVNYPAGVTINN